MYIDFEIHPSMVEPMQKLIETRQSGLKQLQNQIDEWFFKEASGSASSAPPPSPETKLPRT